ncbi:MAG TPA: hypothetical protein VIM29_11550 [Bacillota bacterium]
MAKEVWEQIQAAEAEAEQIVATARNQSIQAVKDARQEATVMIRKAEAEARAEGEALLKRKAVEFETAKQSRLDQIDVEVQELISRSEQRIPGAVKLVVEKVVS